MSVQRDQALALANHRRAILKTLREDLGDVDLKAGCGMVAAILADPTDHEAAIPVGRLLLSIDRFGVSSLQVVLRAAGIMSADRRVRDLTVRQRSALGVALERRASTYRDPSKRRAVV
jgi:hypothetical protein